MRYLFKNCCFFLKQNINVIINYIHIFIVKKIQLILKIDKINFIFNKNNLFCFISFFLSLKRQKYYLKFLYDG